MTQMILEEFLSLFNNLLMSVHFRSLTAVNGIIRESLLTLFHPQIRSLNTLVEFC